MGVRVGPGTIECTELCIKSDWPQVRDLKVVINVECKILIFSLLRRKSLKLIKGFVFPDCVLLRFTFLSLFIIHQKLVVLAEFYQFIF